MSRQIVELMMELRRHGVQLLPSGRLETTASAPTALLMRAHRHRRALAVVQSKPGG